MLFQFGNNTPLAFYQALSRNPEARDAFDMQMQNNVKAERMHHHTGFASIYDFEGVIGPLINSADDVALVDVGGSRGHVLEDVIQHLPGLKGRLVLQDLPETLQDVDLDSRVELCPYNFIDSQQPIKGAAVYLFRQIFLNWNDAHGHQILRNTRNLPLHLS